MTTTITPEDVFKNWSRMHDWISKPGDALKEPVTCAHCLIEKAYERFGADHMCGECLILIANVLGAVRNGIEHGSIYVAE